MMQHLSMQSMLALNILIVLPQALNYWGSTLILTYSRI